MPGEKLRVRTFAVIVLAFAALVFAFARSGDALGTSGAATLAPCANPALPVAILAGPAASSPLPLPTTIALAPRAKLVLAVAADERSRELGLMCVLKLRPQGGMIFVFDRDARQEFWMKNTLISLDMIWIHDDGTVDTVAANVPASTRGTPDAHIARRSGTGRYVIELAAGGTAKAGILIGSRVGLSLPP